MMLIRNENRAEGARIREKLVVSEPPKRNVIFRGKGGTTELVSPDFSERKNVGTNLTYER